MVDSLEVTDLAGASARLSGRIGADGTGRVSGRLKAPVAAPLLGLLERVWVGEIRLLPAFLRDAPLDLAVTLDREGGAAEALRTQARGSAGGGTLDLTLASRGTQIEGGTATLAAPRAGAWFGRADIAGLQQPATLHLTAERPDAQALSLTVNGTVAGLRLATARPILVGPDLVPTGGEIRADSADLAPFLTLAGAAVLAPGAWPADLTVTLTRQQRRGRRRSCRHNRGSGGEWDGAAGGGGRPARSPRPRPSVGPAAGGRPGDPAGGERQLRAGERPSAPLLRQCGSPALDLGRGLVATDATTALGLADATLTLRDLTAKLAGGRIAGRPRSPGSGRRPRSPARAASTTWPSARWPAARSAAA